MQIKQVQYFLQIAESGSFSFAAEELFISQSSLSKQIIALEKELGILLFDRSNRKISITPAGKTFLKYAHQMQAIHVAMLEDLLQHKESPSLSIIAIPVIAQYGITNYIAKFQTAHPEVPFTLEEREAEEILPCLDKRLFDLAFIRDNYLDKENYHCVDVAEDKLLLVLSKQHPLAFRESISLTELQNENFIMFDKGTVVHEVAVDACREAGFEPRIFYASLRVESILGLVASNSGVALIMEKVFLYRNHPDIVAIHLDKDVTSNIVLAWAKDRKLSASTTKFIDFIEKNNKIPRLNFV
jgi:DNA-binding transcriptional LysR family regulator